MNNKIVIVSEVRKVEAAEIIKAANALEVADQQGLDKANEVYGKLSAAEKYFEDLFRPHIDRAWEAHKSLTADLNSFNGPIKTAKAILSPKIGGYIAEQQRIQREALAAKARAEQAAREEADKATVKALDLDAEGKHQAADKVLARGQERVYEELAKAPEIPAGPIAPGLSARTDWKFEIVDESKVPRQYMMVDETKIGKVVRATKGQINIPGIRTFSVTGTMQRKQR